MDRSTMSRLEALEAQYGGNATLPDALKAIARSLDDSSLDLDQIVSTLPPEVVAELERIAAAEGMGDEPESADVGDGAPPDALSDR